MYFSDRDSSAVVGADDDDVRRALADTSLRRLYGVAGSLDRSRKLDALSLHLTRHGFTGTARDLRADEPALSELRAEVDPRSAAEGTQFFGIRFSASMSFSVVGVVLGVLSFAMLGPVTALRRTENPRTQQPWILVMELRHSVAGIILESMISLVTVLWALSPRSAGRVKTVATKAVVEAK